MKKMMIIFLSALLSFGCNAQTGKDIQNDITSKQGEIKPKEDYKVNKIYDDNGNLIGYDSTYTYYYSNIDKDAMVKDSVFIKFNKYYRSIDSFDRYPFKDDFFDGNNFNEDDFFKQEEMMERMMRRIDSLKNRFLMQEHPIEENRNHKKKKKEEKYKQQ